METIEQWFQGLPPVTRAYLVLSFLTTAACSLDVINPFQIYFNLRRVLEGEVWRLLTCFLYFGNFSVEFVFQMFLLVKYCRSLEEGSFRARSADFFWMLFLGASMILLYAMTVNVQFLGQSLTFMVVYVWARRNQYVRLSLFGLFTFTAPYLPWVLLGFSVLLGASPVIDLLGMAAGHIYYFFEDVYPRMAHGRLLATPRFITILFVETPPPVARQGQAQARADAQAPRVRLAEGGLGDQAVRPGGAAEAPA